MSMLIIFDPHGGMRYFEIEPGSYTLGRGQCNDIILHDKTASRKHAILIYGNGGIMIKDTGSTKGIYLNNKRITNKAHFCSGDTIQLGSTQVAVEATDIDSERTERINAADIHHIPGLRKTASPLTLDSQARPSEQHERHTPLASAAPEPEKTLFMRPGDLIARIKGPRLVLISGDLKENIYPLNRSKLMIGRDIGCHIRIDERSVSNYHAMILKNGNKHYLKDLGSKNGVLINGSLVHEKRRLRDGDKIAISHLIFTYLNGNAAHLFLPKLPAGRRTYIIGTMALFSILIAALLIVLVQREPYTKQPNDPLTQLPQDNKGPTGQGIIRKGPSTDSEIIFLIRHSSLRYPTTAL